MSDPYLGEIQAFPFPIAFGGFNQAWLPCLGQTLSVSQYTALFSLVGTYYGGNGTTTFMLPNMVGAITNNQGTGPGLQPRQFGESIGAPSVALTTQEMASHSHGLQLGSSAATGAAPGPGMASNMAAINPLFNGFVAPPSNVTLSQNAMSLTGQGQGHNNNQPTQALVWCIAVRGIYPTFSQG